MSESTENVVAQPQPVSRRGVQIGSMGDAIEFASRVAKSGMCPRGMDSPEKILVAMQTGMEAGLSPMQAIRSVVVINGLPSWKGDAGLGLVRASGKMQNFRAWNVRDEKNPDESAAYVESLRAGNTEPTRHSFSVAMAKRAGLWGKTGPWSQYPQRMLYYRALGFHLRDA